MADPTLTQIDDRELENMSVDAANFPYKKTRGMLYWDGSAWQKWTGALTAGTATIGSVKITDGTDTATVASTLDSRNGLDIQHSSVASKQLVYFHSDNASHRMTALATKDFPTDIPGGATWFDMDGYMGFSVDWVDNTSGALGATLYAIWSEDQTVYAEEFPPGGNTQAFFTTDSLTNIDNNIHKFIPKQGRYVKLRLVNGNQTQGATVPNIATLKITALPAHFTNSVIVSNSNPISVAGDNTDVVGAAATGIVVAGVDVATAPANITPIVIDTSGNAAVKGTATNYTSTPIVTATKLTTSASPGASTVSVAASSTQVFASNTDRLGFRIWNNGPEVVYIKYGSAATSTSNTYTILPYEELVVTNVGYSGVIHHIAPVATGTLVCNEW